MQRSEFKVVSYAGMTYRICRSEQTAPDARKSRGDKKPKAGVKTFICKVPAYAAEVRAIAEAYAANLNARSLVDSRTVHVDSPAALERLRQWAARKGISRKND